MQAARDSGLLRRVLAFGGLPFLSLITPFLFLPVLARVGGAEAWLAIAIGQSVGAFAALVVSLGYNTVGPTMVGVAKVSERPGILRASLAPRLLLFVPVGAAAAVIAALIAPTAFRVEAALMALVLALSGLAATWYMVGIGRVASIIAFDLAPRMIATALAALVLIATGSVLWYPVLLFVAAVGGTGAFLFRTLRGTDKSPEPRVRDTLRGNASAMAIEIAGGAYNSLAVTFVGLTATVPAAAVYVSGDKLYRMGQYASSALGNATQGWVVEAAGTRFRERVPRAFIAHLTLGVVGFVTFVAAGPSLSGLLFGDAVAIGLPESAAFGVAAFAISMGTFFGRVVLVAVGARREFLVSVVAGAAAGVPAILILAAAEGAAGGAWGLAIGELVSTTLQAGFAIRLWRRGGWPVAMPPPHPVDEG